jgi:cyclic pyranopterin phosphate synthase
VLTDSFGRVVADVRLSLTDKCNFRCTYCMPAAGLEWLGRDKLLRPDEIERVARVFVALGIRSFKLTGGEPMVRPELVEIVGRLRAIDDDIDLSLTTNGYLLEGKAAALKEAGLDRVTVSCDSLHRHRFAEITRRDAFDSVMRGIGAATDAGLAPIKINCVVMRDTNADEVVAFAALARDSGYHVRFIEYMPLDADGVWDADRVVPSEDLRALIDASYPLVANDAAGPAVRFDFADGAPGSVGFISSVSEPFCASCDRVRVTADGQLRACLFAIDETDLRTPLRDGASDEAIAELIRSCVASKWAGHKIGQEDFERPSRSMSQIGG